MVKCKKHPKFIEMNMKIFISLLKCEYLHGWSMLQFGMARVHHILKVTKRLFMAGNRQFVVVIDNIIKRITKSEHNGKCADIVY